MNFILFILFLCFLCFLFLTNSLVLKHMTKYISKIYLALHLLVWPKDDEKLSTSCKVLNQYPQKTKQSSLILGVNSLCKTGYLPLTL